METLLKEVTMMKEETKVIQESTKPVFGKVSRCNYLHVRSEPSKSSRAEAIIDKDEVVEIGKSVNDLWCEVKLKNGINGFCMSKFITKIL